MGISGGGGSVQAPKTYSPKEYADAELALQRALQADADVRAEKQAIADAEERARIDAAWGGSRDLALENATTRLGDFAGQHGLAGGRYDSMIQDAIGYADNNVVLNRGENVEDASPYYGGQFDDAVQARLRDDISQAFVGDINAITPSGFQTGEFGATSDDAYLNAILQDQYDGAMNTIANAFDRGTLTQTGFDSAVGQLDTQRTSALSELQGIGDAVRQDYQGQLSDFRTNAFNRANTWDYNSGWTPDNYATNYGNFYDDLQSRFEGDVRGAVGDQQFFDALGLVNQGGISAGVVNPAAQGNSALLAAVEKKDEDDSRGRGVGNQGVF